GVFALSVAVAASALAFRIAGLHAGAMRDFFYQATCCRMDALAMGAALAAVLRTSRATLIARWGLIAAVAGATVFVVVAVVTGGLRRDDLIMQTVGYSALALTFSALIAGVVASRLKRGLLAKSFRNSVLR